MKRLKLMESKPDIRVYSAKHDLARVISSPTRNYRYLFGTLWLVLVLMVTACGAAETPANGAQDIAIEAQAVATATPASVEEVAPSEDPAADQDQGQAEELSTEIIEPVSPLSPVTTPESSDLGSSGPVAEMVKAMDIIPGSEKAVTAAIVDLSEQIGISPNEITLVSVEPQEWPDTSLGCPREGYMYAQVITPGYNVVLEAQGEQYNYHTDSESTVVLCQE